MSHDAVGSKTRPRLVVAAALAIFVLVGIAVANAAQGSTATIDFGITARTTGPAPFRGTVEPSVAAAEALLGVHIPRPHTHDVNDWTAWSVVVDERNRDVAITYGQAPGAGPWSGPRIQIVVSFRGLFYAKKAGYLRWARTKVRAGGASTSLITVNGRPAIFFRGNYPGDCGHTLPGQEGCAPAQNNPTAISMQFGRSSLDLYAPSDWGLWDTLALASTIR